jgi:hypothetical protein
MILNEYYTSHILRCKLSPFSTGDYDLARPGSFRLSPPESQRPALERDYRAMRDMFYRQPPEFEDVLRSLSALENEINTLA